MMDDMVDDDSCLDHPDQVGGQGSGHDDPNETAAALQ
jgi:hypothetical protein